MIGALLLGIARLGYRGAIPAHALTYLLQAAQDYGLAEVLGWIDDDPGYLLVPNGILHAFPKEIQA